MKLTFSEYQEERRCPYCLAEEEDLDFSAPPEEPSQNILRGRVKCEKCKATWLEVFTLTAVIPESY